MKKILFLICLFQSIHITGQKPAGSYGGLARNSLLAGFGGSGIYTSIMYERSIIQTGRFQFGAKGGVGFSPLKLSFPREWNFPVGIFLIYGENNHHPDLSLNVASLFIQQYDLETGVTFGEYNALFIPTLAYRFQKPTGGVTLKFGLSPVFYFNSVRTSIVPWFELGAGWSF